MNAIDWVILAVVGIFALQGFRKGLLREVAGLLGVVVAFILSVRLLSDVSALISYYLGISPQLAVVVSGFVIFFVVLGLFIFLARLLRKILDWALLGWVDRVGGSLFGLLKGTLIVSILALLISLIPLGSELEKAFNDSVLFHPVRAVAPAVFNGLMKVAPRAGDFYGEMEQSLRSRGGEISSTALQWLNTLRQRQESPPGEPPSQKLQRDGNS